MSVLLTGQYKYEVLLDTTAINTALDGSTAGYTYDWTDKPATAAPIGPEFNGVEIFFIGGQKSINSSGDGANGDTTGTTDGTNWDGKLWGYAEGGPAEHICDISVTAGTARISDYTTALYADTITISNDTHLTTVTATDSGNNRVCKIDFDAVGYKYIHCDITVLTSDLKGYLRAY